MRKIEELIDTEDPAINLLKELVRAAEVPCRLLPPSAEREDTLLAVQVSTHSTLGALAYDTGGLLIDDGWVRLLGSGHPTLPRTLHKWNDHRADGFFLVGDDAIGGFFALNGGALGSDLGSVHYWAPDSLEWECLELGLTDFVNAFLTSRITEFYKGLRWSTWRSDLTDLSSEQCFFFYPFMWTKEGSVESSDRSKISISEAFDSKVDIVRQLASDKAV